MRRVWIDGWQLQCCGDAFEVGSVVEWTVAPVDLDFLQAVLGDEEAAHITHAEEHHSRERRRLAALSGEVRSISSVHCVYGPSPKGGAMYPVPGTARVESKLRADGWEQESEVLRFLGYLVDRVSANRGRASSPVESG